MTVLLIHNQKERLSDIRQALENCKCTYFEADDPHHALAFLVNKEPAIHTIIMDYDPVRENPHFLKELSKNDTLRDIPLILNLKEDEPTTPRAFKHSGSHLWLQHPFTEKLLYSMILSTENELSQRRALRREIHSRESVIGSITRGTFHIKTFKQAEALTTMLSLACPEPDRVAFGLFELLANGIEHGNLGISHAEKQDLIEKNLHREEIKRRLALPENKDKYVEIIFERESNLVSFKITDQGKGFDYNIYLEANLSDNISYHGRGIALAQATSFDYLEYLDKGNKVFAITKFSSH